MRDPEITRRRFAASMLSGAAFLARGVFPGPITTQQPRVLRVGLLLPGALSGVVGGTDQVGSGVALAFNEIERAANQSGQQILLVERQIISPSALMTSARDLISGERVSLIIGGLDVPQSTALGSFADEKGVPFLNAAATADSLRRVGCRRQMFHIAVSDSMVASARAQLPAPIALARPVPGRRTAPRGRTVPAPAPPVPARVPIEQWHYSLQRDGAAQLNDRYRSAFSQPMTSQAWAGWMALKIAWDAFVRGRSADRRVIAATLEDPATVFDGHKGTPLSFRAWDHQLRQPLYAIGGAARAERVIAELPDVRRTGGVSVLGALDRFGDDARIGNCLEKTGR